jgi:hypothetical protein
MERTARDYTSTNLNYELLTLSQVAVLANVSPSMVLLLLRAGKFPDPDWWSGSKNILRLWKRTTIEKFIRERGESGKRA